MEIHATISHKQQNMDSLQHATRLYQQFRHSISQSGDEHQTIIYALNSGKRVVATIEDALIHMFLFTDMTVTYADERTRTLHLENSLYRLKFTPFRQYLNSYTPPHNIDIIDKKGKQNKDIFYLFEHDLRMKVDDMHRDMLYFIFDNINKPIVEIANNVTTVATENVLPHIPVTTLWKFNCCIKTNFMDYDEDDDATHSYKWTKDDVCESITDYMRSNRDTTIFQFTVSDQTSKISWNKHSGQIDTDDVLQISGTTTQPPNVTDGEMQTMLNKLFLDLKKNLNQRELKYEYKKCENVVVVKI